MSILLNLDMPAAASPAAGASAGSVLRGGSWRIIFFLDFRCHPNALPSLEVCGSLSPPSGKDHPGIPGSGHGGSWHPRPPAFPVTFLPPPGLPGWTASCIAQLDSLQLTAFGGHKQEKKENQPPTPYKSILFKFALITGLVKEVGTQKWGTPKGTSSVQDMNQSQQI